MGGWVVEKVCESEDDAGGLSNGEEELSTEASVQNASWAEGGGWGEGRSAACARSLGRQWLR